MTAPLPDTHAARIEAQYGQPAVFGALARAEALAADDPDWMNCTRWPREPSADREAHPVTAPLLAMRDALAEAIAPGAFAHEYRREVRASHGIPMGVACAQDEAYEIADRILTSGVVRDPATLADDETLVEGVGAVAFPTSHGIHGRVDTRRVLVALAAALTEDPS